MSVTPQKPSKFKLFLEKLETLFCCCVRHHDNSKEYTKEPRALSSQEEVESTTQQASQEETITQQASYSQEEPVNLTQRKNAGKDRAVEDDDDYISINIE